MVNRYIKDRRWLASPPPRKLYNFCKTWTNVEDVGFTLYNCYINVLCLLARHSIRSLNHCTRAPANQDGHVYCGSGNIREVLIFVHFSRRTNSLIQESR